jgi:hypothetical protein
VSETSEPMSNTITVARATRATVTATKRITPITGETALSSLFTFNMRIINREGTG